MCGIVGAVAQRDVAQILIEGLRRLEYRGYDSAGVAVIDHQGTLNRVRTAGKVKELDNALSQQPISGGNGVAHTRWATHGEPSVMNAHPHVYRDCVAVVHNGIIENHDEMRNALKSKGNEFTSDTDTEVIVHQVYEHVNDGDDLLTAVNKTIQQLEGAFALGVVSIKEPGRLIAAREGSPLVIGLGIGENFIASDVAALLPVTKRFIFLENGDVADIYRDKVIIYDRDGNVVQRKERESELSADAVDRGSYRHYMLKEIHEQPRAIAETLEGRLGNERLLEESFGHKATELFAQVKHVQIVACGTSYHAGFVAKYWIEELAGVTCSVEVASEYRYRRQNVPENSMFLTISQSGETADTLAALHLAKELGYSAYLAVCNVPESSLVRESDLVLMTRAGPEIGVASTKAFTTQLVALSLVVIALGRRNGMTEDAEKALVHSLNHLPVMVEEVLELDKTIQQLSERFADKHHALFLGRGAQFPVAMEGALKLKEISYIHAEAYPAGELKHGPLALVDGNMPVIAVAPNNELQEKLKSNLHEVRARGGELFIFADKDAGIEAEEGVTVIPLPAMDDCIAPIVYTIPLQLLAYHVAVLKGTDVDQPRNLAKSVTVE